MTEIKYNFSNHISEISNANIKKTKDGSKYFELTYPIANTMSPVLKYNDSNYYPVRLVITKPDATNYNMIIETYKRETNGAAGPRLFISVILTHADNTKEPLLALFSAISKGSETKTHIQLNSLFDETSFNVNTLKKSSTSDNLTLHITTAIQTKLFSLGSNDLGAANLLEICPTMTLGSTQTQNDKTNLKFSISEFTQRQKCKRSTDNASEIIQVDADSSKSKNAQSNVLVIVIIGLCIAAFFQEIYKIVVCLPVGNHENHGAIHLMYVFGLLSIVIPLFVRGFKDGDILSQIWGGGIIIIMLIFFYKYNHLSTALKLMCGKTEVPYLDISHHFKQFNFSSPFTILYLLFQGIFLISASAESSKHDVFKGLLITQGVVTVLAVVLFNTLVESPTNLII